MALCIVREKKTFAMRDSFVSFLWKPCRSVRQLVKHSSLQTDLASHLTTYGVDATRRLCVRDSSPDAATVHPNGPRLVHRRQIAWAVGVRHSSTVCVLENSHDEVYWFVLKKL